MKKTLKNNNDNISAMLDTISDLVVVATPDGKILFANKTLTEKLGYSPKDLKKMHVLDLNPSADRKKAKKIFKDILLKKRDFCPLPIVTKDGRLLPAETRAWMGKWDGQPAVFGFIREISKEQEERQKFEQLFQSNPSPMVISSLDDRKIIDINRAFTKILGYSKDDIVGKTSQEISLFVNPSLHKEIAKELKDKGRITGRELQVRRKNNGLLHGMFYGEIISSQGKNYFLTVMVDITALKQAEDKLKSIIRDLEKTNEFLIGRELRMAELKKEIKRLKQ